MIKRFIIAIVLLIIVVGGIVGFNRFRDTAIEQFFANMPVATLTVSAVKVEPQAWTPNIEAIGTAFASRGVNLTVEAAGVVQEVMFTPNQKVKQGDVLLRLDDAVQQADLEVAKTAAALDQQAYDRALELQRRGVGSEVTLDAARATASKSATQVARYEAMLRQRKLIAPHDGTIGIPRVNKGEYIAPGNIVATLQDLDTLRADFSVPEQQLGNLRVGQPVRFGLSADQMIFEGSITGIEPKVDPATRLVGVRASIDNPEGRVSPGQFVQVRVTLPTEEGVIAAPQTALTSSLYGDFVYIVRPADKAEGAAADAEPTFKAVQVFVRPGRRVDGMVEILSGVAAGDEVVTAGQNRLSNNAPVKVDNTVNPVAQPAAAAEGAAK